jgi:hypothetical protein
MKDPQTPEPIDEEPEVPGYPDDPELDEESDTEEEDEDEDSDEDDDDLKDGEAGELVGAGEPE